MEKFPSIDQIKKMTTPTCWDVYRYLTYNMVENTLSGGVVQPLPEGVATFVPATAEDMHVATKCSNLFIYLAQYKAIADANLYRMNAILSTYKGLIDSSITAEQAQAYFAADLFSLPRVHAAVESPVAPFLRRGIGMFVDGLSAVDAAAQRAKCVQDSMLLLDSIYAAKGFNLSLELISKEIRVPQLTRLKLTELTSETPVFMEFQALLDELRELLTDNNSPYAAQKRDVLDTLPIFTLNPDEIRVPAKTVAQVKYELRDLDLFSVNDNRIADLLMTRPKEA